MRHLRVTAAVDMDRAPTFYQLLADSPAIRETRVLELNRSTEQIDTVLFAIDGDATEFGERAPDTQGIESVVLSGVDGRWTYALVETRPLETPMFDAIHRARTRPGLVVRTPVVYRDGDMQFRVVGGSEPLQAALDTAPDAMDVRVDVIGTPGTGPGRHASGVSERQRQAVEVALELGYYDDPRGATHADIAAELDCTPSTAGSHLRRAEAKLVAAAMDEFGPPV